MSDCCTDACCCGKVIDATVVTPVIGSKRVEPGKYKGSAAKVFFSPIIDAEHLIKLYNLVNSEIYGRVAIKLHTGEKHGPNILPRDLVKALRKRFLTATSSKPTHSMKATATQPKATVKP